jgi:hypothetical protein
MNTNRTTKSLLTRASAIGVGFLAAIATIGLAAPAASALPPDGPDLESVAEATPFVPVPGVFELLVPTLPTADVVVDCDATDRVRVEVGNHTTASFLVETHVDNAPVDSQWVNPDNAHGLALDFAENDTHDVAVTTGATTLFEEAVTLDCLVPAPSYETIQNCDTQQAHARLVNDGDDTAWMGVQYPDVTHMEIEIAPHSSKDWLLAVSAGESVAFEVVSSGVTLGSEVFEFTCPVAPPAATPEPAPAEPTTGPVPVADTTEPAPIEVAPIEVDLSVGDTTSAEAEPPAEVAGGNEELAAPVEIELAGSEHGNGPAIAMGLVLVGLTALGGVVVAATRNRQV